MAKVLLAITRQKKKLAKVKYASIRLGRDVFVYPPLAKNELKALGITDLWLLDSEIPDDKLEQRDVKYLKSKNIQISVGDNYYITSLYDELNTLVEWVTHGIHSSEREEFMQRAMFLKARLEPVVHYLFDSPVKERIFKLFVDMKNIKESDKPFPGKNNNLVILKEDLSKQFRELVIEILRKPRELDEIVALAKVNESNARRWLAKLELEGIITKTRKRVGIGRPKNIYYLSQRIRLENSAQNIVHSK
ncbi:MAG: hypothetical protein ACP5H8_02190 [Candidatus Micrarchaeia archaeon]